MATSLNEEGRRLLAFLRARFTRISVSDLATFPTYMSVHEGLALGQIGKTWGESLDRQGMSNLAVWAFENDYPALTGMIVDKGEKRPGNGYFQLYGKDSLADGQWWLDEVAKAVTFRWPTVDESGRTMAAVEQEDTATGRAKTEVRTLADLLTAESRIFLKSEWGPVSTYWPALSFSKRSVGDFLNQEYRPGRDFIVCAGTGNSERTREADFRKRLLSVLIVETGQPVSTEELVPWESWRRELQEHGKVWPLSFGVLKAWQCTDIPWAHDVTPQSYRALGYRSNWGGVTEVESAEERVAVSKLALTEVALPPIDRLRKVTGERDRLREILGNAALNGTLTRLQDLIKSRLGGGRAVMRQLPARSLPTGTNLFLLLDKKWRAQGGMCLLCGRELQLDTKKKLMQCSPDRIDSKNPSYGEENLQITHLACNLAKNDATAAEFEEWIQMIR